MRGCGEPQEPGAGWSVGRKYEQRQEALSFSEISSVVKWAQGHDQFRSMFAGDESQEATVRAFLQKV